MSKFEKTYRRIISEKSDKNIDFQDLRRLLLFLGFKERVRGSHHIYSKEKIIEIINLQPNNNKAKAYQVKQVRELLNFYKLIINLYE